MGRSVDVTDLLRVGGRYRDDRVRPVLKLRSTWDRRLILSSRQKLKDYTPHRIFINPDEPLEVRRKATLDRLKKKYESDGKVVTVADGCLIVDNEVMFSLENGFVRH
jgi:hypothetical protein